MDYEGLLRADDPVHSSAAPTLMAEWAFRLAETSPIKRHSPKVPNYELRLVQSAGNLSGCPSQEFRHSALSLATALHGSAS